MIVQYAIIWYLTKETGSATILSIATILGMLPMALLSPFVGPLVDRWNKKALLIVPDVVAAIFAIILSVSGGVFHVFPIWLIFVSLLMRSIAQTFQMPTIQQSYPPQQLGRVLGVLNSLMSLTGPIGLIFAGPLADALGVEMLFVIAGIGTVICGIFALMIPIMREYDLKLQARLAKED